MEIGIDTFAAAQLSPDRQVVINSEKSLKELLDRVVASDEMGLDIFGLGEHHRKEFLDSSPNLLLAAAAVKTKRIRLTSAVTVLSAHDPVRIFQDFATIDLLSNGRAEMVAGRGSFIDAFPLFGLELRDYDHLFEEKLDLLLRIMKEPVITWSGKYRPALHQQSIYPRPLQNPFPIWLGAGGTPESFVRAGRLGLPLMVAIIGGETHRFRPLVDLYREAGAKAGFSKEQLKIGLHSFGYVAENSQQAADDAFAGLSTNFQEIRKERGWPQMTREQFDYQCAPLGAYLIGSPDEVAEKILRHSEALGGISRVTFQMDGMQVGHEKLLKAIELIGTKIKPQIQG
jgi:probable LLM family oxidoreductase